MVTYHFPPENEVGAFRALKFAKYLPEFGFMPVVLTVRHRSSGARDVSLLSDVPSEVMVVETFAAEHRVLRAPGRVGISPKWFLVPDAQVGWLPFAVRKGEAVIRGAGIEMIYATAPPYTCLLTGLVLKRRTGCPLVIDFRDPWTQNAFTRYPTRFHRRLEERMEEAVLRAADRIITTTEEMKRELITRYPVVHGRCQTIFNGYDPDDFAGVHRTPAAGRFTIAYAGKLYGLRSAESFAEALSRLVQVYPTVREQIRVVFAGPRDAETRRLVQRLGLHDVVEQVGLLSHRQSLQVMVDADVLLLLMSEREVFGSVGAMMIPGKTFEYLGARRPILALVPEGDAAALIRRTGSGVVVHPRDVPAIERAIFDLFARWQQGNLSLPSRDLSMYERRWLTAQLAAALAAAADGTQRISTGSPARHPRG